MGVIVGSTKTFWPHFERYIRGFDEKSVPKDPMDSFYQYSITSALSSHPIISKIPYEVRYDWNTPRSGLFVHVQTAGHLAGFAFYDKDVQWSCHPTYGLWFVYRAVITFDLDWSGPPPPQPTPVLDEETKKQMRVWTEVANSEKWQVRSTRLKLRDSCPIGKDRFRYDGDCLSFFFPIHETPGDVIDRIRSRSSSNPPCQQNSDVNLQNGAILDTHSTHPKVPDCCEGIDPVSPSPVPN